MLFVSSGGVARVWCPELPRPLAIFLALVIAVEPDELDQVHEVRVSVSHEGGATPLAQIVLGFQPQPNPILHPGEAQIVSLALPLGPIAIQELGPHDVRVSVDSGTPRILTLYAEKPPAP